MLPQAAQACRQVAAGREAHDRDSVRIGMPLCRMAAHIGDGRRRVVLGQREDVFRCLIVPGGRVLPANLILRLRAHAVPEDEHVEALRQKAQRDRLGLPLAAKRIAAAGADDNRRALDPGIDLPGNARNIHIHANLGAARGRHKNAFVEHIDLLILGYLGAAGPNPRLGISSPNPFFASRIQKELSMKSVLYLRNPSPFCWIPPRKAR